MVFVKRKKASFDWSMPKHLTTIQVKEYGRERLGKPSIYQESLEVHVYQLVSAITKLAGIKNYRIVYLEEDGDALINELPPWDEIEKMGCAETDLYDVLDCLEKKLGKEYIAITFTDIPAYAVVETQQQRT